MLLPAAPQPGRGWGGGLGGCKKHLITLVEDLEPTKGARGMEHSRTTVEFLYPFSNPCESWDEFLFLAKRRGSLAACHVPDSPGGSEERPAGATPQPFCSDVWYNAEGDPDSTFW